MSESPQIDELLQQGIAAAKAGRKEEAQRLLTQAVELDEHNEQGWLWLSGVVTTFEDRQICLENVLALNPDNAHARAGLEWLRQNAPPPAAPAPAEEAAAPLAEEAAAPRLAEAATAPAPAPMPPTVQTARQYVEGGAAQEAVDLLTQILREQPLNAEAHLLLGDAFRQLGQQARAREQYEHVCRATSKTSELGQEARHKLAEVVRGRPGEEQHLRAQAARAGRPGCVTVYAILTVLGGALGILGACAVVGLAGTGLTEMQQVLEQQSAALPISAEQLTTLIWVVAGISLVFSTLYVVVGVGLWLMKNWARIAVIALQGLSLLGGLAQAAIAILSTRETQAASIIQGAPVCSLGGFVVGFALQAYIIFWFVVNRDRFA